MIEALDNTTLDEFLTIVRELPGWTERPYQSVYVSIGGKQNEPYCTFNYPKSIEKKQFRSNATNQMIPAFIANRRETKGLELEQNITLVVVIDSFRSPEEWSTNLRILQNQIKDNTLFDILLWNQEMNTRTLTRTVGEIAKQALLHNVADNQFMICNYVRFSHPNEAEMSIEDYIPTQIQSVLNDTPYDKCFYQWYGYSVFLYNMVYCYKDYHLWRALYSTHLHTLFEKHAACLPIWQNTIQMIRDANDQDPRILSIINQFARFTIDITSSYRKRGELASNML